MAGAATGPDDGPRDGVRAGQRVVEKRHQSVPGEVFESGLETKNLRTQGLVVLAEHSHHLFGFGGLRERRKPPEIAEHYGDFPPVALHEPLFAGGNDEFGKLRREKSLQLAEALQFCELFRYPLLKFLVPLR